METRRSAADVGAQQTTTHIPGLFRDVTVDSFDPIAEIQSKLLKYPHVQYESSQTHITVLPLDAAGFLVQFVAGRGGYGVPRFAVNCEGCHAEFTDVNEALDYFYAALTDSSRLEVWRCGRTPYKWILQRRTHRGWQNLGESRRGLVAFWRPLEIVHLQNRLLEAA